MKGYSFVHPRGDFVLPHADRTNGLYFPLANEAGYMAAITPTGGGDAKIDQNHFLLPPAAVVDLHNTRFTRTIWVRFDDGSCWSATGSSHEQKAAEPELHTVEAGLLWHKTIRKHAARPLTAEIVSFVPNDEVTAEVVRFTLRNTGASPLRVLPTAVVPLFGRSADSLRDHRHVTALLNRVEITSQGVLLQPSMSFDERGHSVNTTVYAVMGRRGDGSLPTGCFADLDSFIGEGGDLERPAVIYSPEHADAVRLSPGDVVEGSEALGAVQFDQVEIAPGAEIQLYCLAGVFAHTDGAARAAERYCNPAGFEAALAANREFWDAKLNTVSCTTGNSEFDAWMRWVSLQPILRRLYGCSFLPYHDYGRGGRGWRDLWQDCLALLLMEPDSVRESLLQNLAGVRFDGTNATIIGSRPGEFVADRNNITRVWMDHGAWPLMTIQLYIDQTGDSGFLFESQTYFSDPQWGRASRKLDATRGDTLLYDQTGGVVRGSVFEHLLLQQLSAFFHVGDHNSILLEGADWNDGLDMAADRGESVAFTGQYAANLAWLAGVLEQVSAEVTEIALHHEILQLLDRYAGTPVDYDDPAAKRARLQSFFDSCQQGPSGEMVNVAAVDLAADLRAKSDAMIDHLRNREWIQTPDGHGWFNGYYDNDGERVEGGGTDSPRMTLTGQVFQVLGGVADEQQVDRIVAAADAHLWDDAVGGYRLNTDFRELKLNMGRCFGFAYGHKENGAMFSHMAVMFANALYARGRSQAGWRTLEAIFNAASRFSASRMYPGIPEYFDPKGRGLYPYLTGSASWYLLTVVTRMFGVRGHYGDLVLDPQLQAAQWGELDSVSVCTYFRQRQLQIVYRNPEGLDVGEYRVTAVVADTGELAFTLRDGAAVIDGAAIDRVAMDCTGPEQAPTVLRVELGRRDNGAGV
ncbi:GH36-type glycosyl hydrolase domain-containing protein [Spirochaeta africana]|uniref:Cellobiose phosphorylase n=1 Tax=Spirochaeta africana (strain ATCC 700263 / DSM 8902 / Z-7692) TaxID=889378 RepID=H9UH09_SPIAZ|nr:hypothetical protein [Spirochaeta africana]AFG36802.1 hypothetical protein Spiaf_0702 [Spirochaeta africana DSM 8902]